jgi:hypothetical protein
MSRNIWLYATLAAVLMSSAGRAGPVPFDIPLNVPPVIADSTAPMLCTVTYLIADLANNDLFASRMRIAPAETESPVQNRMPCPPSVPPRVALRALDTCTTRAGEAKYCVFADMGRGFEREPEIRNTSENAARCASDRFSDIAVACWSTGKMSVCNVGCGNAPQEAVANARARCEDKQQKLCPITASMPVSGP